MADFCRGKVEFPTRGANQLRNTLRDQEGAELVLQDASSFCSNPSVRSLLSWHPVAFSP